MGEVVEAAIVPEKQNKETIMNIEKHSADFETINKSVEAAAIPDQQNKETIGNLQDNTKK